MNNSNFMTNIHNKKKKKVETKRIGLITDNAKRPDGKIIKLYKKNEGDDINVNYINIRLKYNSTSKTWTLRNSLNERKRT